MQDVRSHKGHAPHIRLPGRLKVDLPVPGGDVALDLQACCRSACLLMMPGRRSLNARVFHAEYSGHKNHPALDWLWWRLQVNSQYLVVMSPWVLYKNLVAYPTTREYVMQAHCHKPHRQTQCYHDV